MKIVANLSKAYQVARGAEHCRRRRAHPVLPAVIDVRLRAAGERLSAEESGQILPSVYPPPKRHPDDVRILVRVSSDGWLVSAASKVSRMFSIVNGCPAYRSGTGRPHQLADSLGRG